MKYDMLMLATIAIIAHVVDKKGASGGSKTINVYNKNVSPDLQTYAKNPQAFYTPANQKINVHVANQSMGYLNSSYIPLFGFVGMAQGRLF